MRHTDNLSRTLQHSHVSAAEGMASRKSIETSNSNSAPRYTLFLWSSICIPNFFVHRSQITDPCTKKLGMQIELHRNNVYRGAELLLLVSMLFLLAIPKCLLIFKEFFYYTSLYTVVYCFLVHNDCTSFMIGSAFCSACVCSFRLYYINCHKNNYTSMQQAKPVTSSCKASSHGLDNHGQKIFARSARKTFVMA